MFDPDRTLPPRLHVVRAGAGPRWLLLHGAASSGAAYAPLAQQLEAHASLIIPDLLGAGRSPAQASWESLIEQELAALVAALTPSDWPAVIVGHSYGGVLALELARRAPARVAGLVLIEPHAFHLLRTQPASEACSSLAQLATQCAAQVQAGLRSEAAALFYDQWAGAGAFATLAPNARDVVAQGMDKVVATFRALDALEVGLDAYGALAMPTVIIRGFHSPAPLRWLSAQLAATLPRARLFDVVGGGHLAPLTHAADVAWLLARSLLAQGAVPQARDLGFRDTLY